MENYISSSRVVANTRVFDGFNYLSIIRISWKLFRSVERGSPTPNLQRL